MESIVSKEVYFKNNKGQRIHGIFEEPNPKRDEIVIIVHGFASYAKHYLSDLLAGINLNSLRIDLDNQGKSEPDFQEEASITNYKNTLEAAIDFAKDRGYKKISFLGISFGANVVLATALNHPEVKRIALMSPCVDYPNIKVISFSQEELQRYKKEDYYPFIDPGGNKFKINFACYEDSKKYVMFGKAASIKCPVLIIHGTEDERVNFGASEKIIKEFPNGKLIPIKGANHHLAISGDFSAGKEALKEWFLEGK